MQTSESAGNDLNAANTGDETDNGAFRALTPAANDLVVESSTITSGSQPVGHPGAVPAGAATPYVVEDEESGDGTGHSMTVIEHLDELRTRLLRCIAYVFAAFVGALFFTKDILTFLEAPAGNIKIQALSMEEPLVVFFKVAFYVSLVASSPLLLWELSRFVSPGLTRKERSVLAPVVIGGPLLFALGGLFAYKCLLPPMLHFFSAFGEGISPIHQRLDFYISLVSSMLLYMGLCFQMPIIIFALAIAGVVTSSMLIKVWRYAVFGTALVACVITPDPTAFSMLIVMAALNGLYLLSIIMLKFARK